MLRFVKVYYKGRETVLNGLIMVLNWIYLQCYIVGLQLNGVFGDLGSGFAQTLASLLIILTELANVIFFVPIF